MADSRPPNLVAKLNPKRSRASSNRVAVWSWVSALAILAVAAFLLPKGVARGTTFTVLIFLLLVGVVASAARLGTRLSSSDRDMRDHVLPP